MSSDHVTIPHLIEEIQLFIRQQFESQSLPFSKETIAPLLQNSIQQSLTPSSPILSLFTKRIYKLLTRGLLSLPFQELLPAYSLASKLQSQEVKSLILKSKQIFDHSVLIFGPFYSAILRAFLNGNVNAARSRTTAAV
jgi:hypothetical protein